MILATLVSGKQDNMIALPRPTDVSLDESGLIESGAFQPSSSRFIRTDELFIFDNAVRMKNKSASATYYYYNNMWQRYPLTTDVGNETPFQAGNAAVIRKASAATSPLWVNAPNY